MILTILTCLVIFQLVIFMNEKTIEIPKYSLRDCMCEIKIAVRILKKSEQIVRGRSEDGGNYESMSVQMSSSLLVKRSSDGDHSGRRRGPKSPESQLSGGRRFAGRLAGETTGENNEYNILQ